MPTQVFFTCPKLAANLGQLVAGALYLKSAPTDTDGASVLWTNQVYSGKFTGNLLPALSTLSGANLSGQKQGRTLSPRAPFSIVIHYCGGSVMNTPNDLKYTSNDEWVRVEGSIGAIGITDYAQNQLSDIVFVEILVSNGDVVNQGDSAATLESVKAAADVYMPLSGKVIAVNEELPDKPETVNTSPYGEAWMIKIEISDPAELASLLDAAAYTELRAG
jgi:glycine cleavage system H protein